MISLPLLLAAAFLPPALETALDQGRFSSTPAGFRIIALSQIADGCAARADEDPEAARACVEKAYRRARALRGSSGLHRTHLALIMGAADRIGPCLDEAEHRRLAGWLASGSLRDSTGHLPSYPKTARRWPADQTATLAAIGRHDASHGTDLLAAPLEKWRTFMAEHGMDPATALPRSEARGRGTGKHPRGCALSYSVRYLSEVDAALAARWWARYKALYFVDVGVIAGFREWPPGVDRRADIDSGPIVEGVGAAATAFGIAAARAMDDGVVALRLEATAHLVKLQAKRDPKLAGAAGSTLAEAILFSAARQPSS